MDAQPSTPLIPPTPPETPPRISFIPPLYLQRRTAVHAILRKLSSSPRFTGALRSLLDVGCGVDCLLLRSLIPCEDELPIERLTGIDIDADIWSSWCREGISPGSFGGTGAKEDRWRGLDVSLLHGSFTHLNTDIVPRHDVIVSAEVIEHLDPEPLAQFAPVLLGRMKPRVCVITTPNRDFNKVFELPFTPLDNGSDSPGLQPAQSGEPLQGLVAALEDLLLDGNQRNSRRGGEDDNRFWRVGVPYPMRHHDHRFEWTRAEFRKWARDAAEEFGYDVYFTGVGGLDCGTRVKGGTGWAVEKALRDAMAEDAEPTHPDEWETSFGTSEGIYTAELVGDLAARARVVFGHCSQIAVFTIKESETPALEPQAEVDWKSLVTPDNWFEMPSFSVSDIRLVCHEKHPFEEQEVFPPPLVAVLEMVEKTFVQFIPQPILEKWATADECTWDNVWQSNAPAEVVELPGEDEDLEQQRILERAAAKEAKMYMSKLMQGIPPGDVTDVVFTVDFRKLYDASWRLQRACRFHFDVFERVLASAGTYPPVGQVVAGEWATVIDTTTTDSTTTTTGINLTASVLNNTTKATFNFPQPPAPSTEIRYITYEEPVFETQEDYWNSWDDDDTSSRMSVQSADMAAEVERRDDIGVLKLWVEATWGAEATEEVPVAAEKGVLRLGRNGGVFGEAEGQHSNGMALRFRKPPT